MLALIYSNSVTIGTLPATILSLGIKTNNREDLIIYTNPADFKNYLYNLKHSDKGTALLLMSSGNYGGLNFDEVKTLL